MMRVPEIPTTQELHNSYPLDISTPTEIARVRQEYNNALLNPLERTLAIAGYCASPGITHMAVILKEGEQVLSLANKLGDCVSAHRVPVWKPRTNHNDWHGEETTDPAGAFLSIKTEADTNHSVAMEIGYEDMLERYAQMISFAWIGGRNVGNTNLIEAASLFDPSLPLGIKNGLDGDIKFANKQVELANGLRQGDGATVVLIFRGGDNATDPDIWEQEYLRAYELTAGKLIVCVAHGSEMAHDPQREFKKTVEGQIHALDHLISISEQGYAPAGVMIEASGLPSKTDPHMPLQVALNGIERLVISKRTKIKNQNHFTNWVDPDVLLEYEGQSVEFKQDNEQGFKEFFESGWLDPRYDDLRERWEPLLNADEGLEGVEAAWQRLTGKVALWSLVRLRAAREGRPFKIDRPKEQTN